MCSVYTEVNKSGYACFMASSISHVASSGPKYFHYTLTCAMVMFLSGFPSCLLCIVFLAGIIPLVPPESQTSKLYDCNHVHIYLVTKHGKHYVPSLWEEMLVYMLHVPLYPKFQRVHNTKVTTWDNLPFSRSFS
jgi:hypothetical protein